jgi:hypothetical protein
MPRRRGGGGEVRGLARSCARLQQGELFMSTVFVRPAFEKRLQGWSKEDQIYIFALQLSIESMDWDALICDPYCLIETVHSDASGNLRQVDFWYKVRMDYVHLTLELRMPGVFILND